MAVIVLLFLALTTEVLSQGERATLPLTLQPRPLKGGCPSQDEISEIHDEVQSVLQDTVKPIRRQDLNGTNSSDSTHSCSNGIRPSRHCRANQKAGSTRSEWDQLLGVYTLLGGPLQWRHTTLLFRGTVEQTSG